MGGELAPTPVSYGTLSRRATQVICGAMRGHFWTLTVQPLTDSMRYEGFLVLLMGLRIYVARSKETCVTWYGVVVPLLRYMGEECVSKAFSVSNVVGRAAAVFLRGGRATRKERKHQTFSRNFDSTKGYPGEDILPN